MIRIIYEKLFLKYKSKKFKKIFIVFFFHEQLEENLIK